MLFQKTIDEQRQRLGWYWRNRRDADERVADALPVFWHECQRLLKSLDCDSENPITQLFFATIASHIDSPEAVDSLAVVDPDWFLPVWDSICKVAHHWTRRNINRANRFAKRKAYVDTVAPDDAERREAIERADALRNVPNETRDEDVPTMQRTGWRAGPSPSLWRGERGGRIGIQSPAIEWSEVVASAPESLTPANYVGPSREERAAQWLETRGGIPREWMAKVIGKGPQRRIEPAEIRMPIYDLYVATHDGQRLECIARNVPSYSVNWESTEVHPHYVGTVGAASAHFADLRRMIHDSREHAAAHRMNAGA